MTDPTDHTDSNPAPETEADYDYSQTRSPYVIRENHGLVLRVNEVTSDDERYVTIESPPQTETGHQIVDDLHALNPAAPGDPPRWLLPGFFAADEPVGETLTTTEILDNLDTYLNAVNETVDALLMPDGDDGE